MACLEAQAAANEVRAQGLVARIAELEAEAREREAANLQANTALAEAQHCLDEAQARITTGTGELAYLQASGSNTVEPLNDSSSTGGWGSSEPAQPPNYGWELSDTEGWGNSEAVANQEGDVRAPEGTTHIPNPASTLPTANSGDQQSGRHNTAELALTNERRHVEGTTAVDDCNRASQPTSTHGNRSTRGGLRYDFSSESTTQAHQDSARRTAISHNNDADIVRPIPFTRPDNFNDVREWLAYFKQSPGERPLGIPLESSVDQNNMIQVWLWINQATDHLTREEHQLFTTNTLSIMWTPGTFANYCQANPCVEDFVIAQFCGDPSSPDNVLEYWNDLGITLGQAAMFTQFYNHRATAQTRNALQHSTRQGTEAPSSNITLVALTSIQGNRSNEVSHSTGVDDPMGEWVNYGDDDDSDISLLEEAQSLG
ncbi:hypothetical protein JAAARDRAFT_199784 [Jaapia argillacea MUCL 33604]|uniref:Uncharacterized protein n=1 Tax=Jaapia argillacea MUCL 33604 TaxID=933084 RepID=A0A067P7A0_9AGAM|nr:hypothetical protein JAAARDRAFT_199784 [Jaapia argillacea MUCL 33604]